MRLFALVILLSICGCAISNPYCIVDPRVEKMNTEIIKLKNDRVVLQKLVWGLSDELDKCIQSSGPLLIEVKK